MRRLNLALSTVILSVLSISTAFAGAWKQDTVGWKYINDDGSNLRSQWAWIDGNNDGIAESYYFDENGYIATNKDVGGYWVNADGQWVDMYGTVQTKVVNNNMSIAPVTQIENTNNYTSYNTNTGSIYDSMSIAELCNVLNNLQMGTQEWFTVNEILNNKINTEKQNKTVNYDDMDYDDLKQIVTDSCMAGTPNLEAMEALSRADAAGKWKTSKKGNSVLDNNVNIDEMREYILDKINEYRAEKGRTLLELDDELNDYAQVRAEEASEKFSHTRPDGSNCLDELWEMYPNHVMNENLAKDYSYKVVAKEWYDSKGHKRNMMDSRIDRCGIGVYNNTFAFIGLQDK